MWEIRESGSARGVKLFYMAEYCDTLQSKEKRNWENKVCLNNRALRLLDHGLIKETDILPNTLKDLGHFPVRCVLIKIYLGQIQTEAKNACEGQQKCFCLYFKLDTLIKDKYI